MGVSQGPPAPTCQGARLWGGRDPSRGHIGPCSHERRLCCKSVSLGDNHDLCGVDAVSKFSESHAELHRALEPGPPVVPPGVSHSLEASPLGCRGPGHRFLANPGLSAQGHQVHMGLGGPRVPKWRNHKEVGEVLQEPQFSITDGSSSQKLRGCPHEAWQQELLSAGGEGLERNKPPTQTLHVPGLQQAIH